MDSPFKLVLNKTTYIYNPAKPNIKLLLVYGRVSYEQILHQVHLPRGLGVFRFCYNPGHWFGPEHLEIIGWQNHSLLTPLSPGINNVFIVSEKATPPSLKDFCIAKLLSTRSEVPSRLSLGKYLQKIPLPKQLIEEICTMKHKLLNMGLEKPYPYRLSPCVGCVYLTKSLGQIPSH